MKWFRFGFELDSGRDWRLEVRKRCVANESREPGIGAQKVVLHKRPTGVIAYLLLRLEASRDGRINGLQFLYAARFFDIFRPRFWGVHNLLFGMLALVGVLDYLRSPAGQGLYGPFVLAISRVCATSIALCYRADRG